jgi:hypothetical protein
MCVLVRCTLICELSFFGEWIREYNPHLMCFFVCVTFRIRHWRESILRWSPTWLAVWKTPRPLGQSMGLLEIKPAPACDVCMHPSGNPCSFQELDATLQIPSHARERCHWYWICGSYIRFLFHILLRRYFDQFRNFQKLGVLSLGCL